VVVVVLIFAYLIGVTLMGLDNRIVDVIVGALLMRLGDIVYYYWRKSVAKKEASPTATP
jgi:hypothetical protein